MRLKPIPLRDPEIVEAEARTYWRGNAEKVPTTSLTLLTVCGVELTSRYNKADEYECSAWCCFCRPRWPPASAACLRQQGYPLL